MRYLFNGVELWELPELPYEYAVIVPNTEEAGTYNLFCSSKPFIVLGYIPDATGAETATENSIYLDLSTSLYEYVTRSGLNTWQEIGERDVSTDAEYLILNNTCIWTNTDIKNEAGELVYPKTAPVPVAEEEEEETPIEIVDIAAEKRKHFLYGLMMGLKVKRLWDKLTTHYLYGTPSESGNIALADGDGYVLYEGGILPEWDRVKFPCAVVGKWALGGGSYRPMICYTTLPLYEAILGLNCPEGCIGLSYMYYEEEWQLAENWEDGSPFGLPSKPAIWANYDIKSYSDSTVLSVEASEPIPLASTEPIGYIDDNIPIYEKKE